MAAPDGLQVWSPSKLRLFCTSENTWGKGAKGRAELAPTPNLQREREPEPGQEWHLGGARAVGNNLAKMALSPDKRPCSMLQKKAKNPRGAVPMWRGGKFLPDPRADDRLFPEHVSKTCLLAPQAAHACQEMAKPSSPSTWSPFRGLQERPNVPGVIELGGKNPCRAWRDTSGCSKALGPRQHLCIPLLTAAAPGSMRGEESELCSAVQEGIPLVLPLLSS